ACFRAASFLENRRGRPAVLLHGSVERILGTHRERLSARIPGTTFSDRVKRWEYDSRSAGRQAAQGKPFRTADASAA
ncbi:hypothetical protein, partial [Rhodovulum sp.]|uniref:hypothetical protein n=1 Tax=Rhodovulum sp. TaxID=34009 RepID=UPI00257DE2AE